MVEGSEGSQEVFDLAGRLHVRCQYFPKFTLLDAALPSLGCCIIEGCGGSLSSGCLFEQGRARKEY